MPLASAMARSPSRAKIKGREGGQTGRFVRLGVDIVDSPAYSSLSPNARSLLVELIRLFNGRNNGHLFLSEQDAANRMGVADRKVAHNTFRELTDAGFIKMTSNAYFSVKLGDGRARSWALTWEFNQKDRSPGTHAFRDYRPTEPVAIKRMDRRQATIKRWKKEAQKLNDAG